MKKTDIKIKRYTIGKLRRNSGGRFSLRFLRRSACMLLAATMANMLTSCGDFLGTEPYLYISDEKAITNYSNATYALTGTYNSLQNYTYYGRNVIVIGDAATDNIIVSPNNSSRFLAESQWSVSPTNADITDFWKRAYMAIDQANRILKVVDNIQATDGQRASIKAQALAIRALCHFDLVKFFAQSYKGHESSLGVPYMKEPIVYEKPARNTVEEVFNFVIQDFQDALTDFQAMENAGFTPSFTEPYYLTYWSTRALLARVYMYQQNYTAAAPVLKDIIDHSGFSLLPASSYVDAWARSYNNTPMQEFMFAIRNLPDDYGNTSGIGYIFIQGGYGDLRAPESLQDLYAPNDIRRPVLFKAGTGTQLGWTFVNKYPNRDGYLGLSDVSVIRYSDVYLMYAEALANTGNIPDAVGYLDAIRKRADVNAADTPKTISLNDLMNLIVLERRKELAYEGQYLFDLKRLNLPISSAYKSDNTHYAEIPYPSERRAYPIPQKERDANKNVEQNPGY